MFPCSTFLEGEYGLNDICIGVPVLLGKNGIESIVEITLSDAEKTKMQESAVGVRNTNGLLDV
jgi:malate dehydrogenase